MSGKIYRIIGLVLGLLVLHLWARQVQAQALAVVSAQPATLTLNTGETGSITITVEQASEVFGYELHLEFDPAVVQLIDANPEQPGVQIQPAGFIDESRGFTVVNRVDNASGVLDYAMTLLAPAEPVSGSGPLLEFGVLAIAPGNSPLTLSAILASSDGVALPIETIDGSLSVTGSQPPGLTPMGTTVVIAPATTTVPAVGTPTRPAPVVTPPGSSGGSAPRQSSSEGSESDGSGIPSGRSESDGSQRLPAVNALQTVSVLQSAVPTSPGSPLPAATSEGASINDPGDVANGEEVALVEPTSPVDSDTITGGQSESNSAEAGAGWSQPTVGLLAGAALIILAGVLFGRRRLAKP